MGDLHKVKVRHDNKGAGPAWYLEKIVVLDPTKEGKEHVFSCQQWLSRRHGDKMISRELGLQDTKVGFVFPGDEAAREG